MIADPFQNIHEAVLQAAHSGEEPAKVIALLIKISVEIAVMTDTLTEDEMHEFVKVLWELVNTEHQVRVATATQPVGES